MLPPATLHLADRLITTLMTLVRALAPSATAPTTTTLPIAAAQALFFRLNHLVIRLIRISSFGIRAPANREPETEAPDGVADPAARSPRSPRPRASRLPRRPGWLLAVLPDLAPAIATEIAALLADPAIATLLDRAPALHRTLSPLLRSLGLALDPTPPPTPAPKSPTPPTATLPTTPPPRSSNPPLPTPSQTSPYQPHSPLAPILLRLRNDRKRPQNPR